MVIFEIGSKKMPSEAGISFVAAERYWEYNCGMDPVRSLRTIGQTDDYGDKQKSILLMQVLKFQFSWIINL